MKKIVVLGSNSFAGSSFVRFLLKNKYFVLATSRSREKTDVFKIYKKLITNKNFFYTPVNINNDKDIKILIKLIKKYRIKNIVDFASQSMVAESWINPEHWVKTNCLGKIKLYSALNKLKKIRLIRISTPEVYGSSINKIKENDSHNPSTPYAVTQSAGDFFLKIFSEYKDFNAINLRFANFYGPGQQLYRLIPKIIMKILSKQKFPLHGNGKSLRSFIYADDFCYSIVNAIKYGKKGETYNISPNKSISIIQLAKLICTLMNCPSSKLIKFSDDRLGKDFKYLLDSKKARKNLHWKDNVSLRAGLEKTISWHKINYKKLSKKKQIYIHKK